MTIPLFWYRGFTNFGDRLSRFLVESVSGKPSVYTEGSPKLLALGSILPFAGNRDTVWGCGAWHERNRIVKELEVRAVRGPLTRSLLNRQGVDCPETYGDPALLLPRYYKPRIVARKGIAVMRHAKDRWFPPGGDRFISVTDDPFYVVDEIASAEILVTSALHGLIVAEAYGVPVVLLRNGKHAEIEPQFKYADYFASTGRDDLTLFDRSLEEAVRKPLPPPVPPDLDRLVEAFPKNTESHDSPNVFDHGAIENLAEFLKRKSGRKTLKLLLREHGGTPLANVGLLQYLKRSKMEFELVDEKKTFDKDILCLPGGGRYVPYYADYKHLLKRYHERNRCIVLPQTIDDDSVRNLSYQTILVCRELESYRFCRRFASCDTYLHDDLSLFVDPRSLGIARQKGDGDCYSFRSDVESRHCFDGLSNFDPSPVTHTDMQGLFESATALLHEVNRYRQVHTDRLQVAFAAFLLEKDCILYPNSYYKNRAVYEYSLKGRGSVRWSDFSE